MCYKRPRRSHSSKQVDELVTLHSRLNLLLLLDPPLPLHRWQHLSIVELSLSHLEIYVPAARHIIQPLGHDKQSRPHLRIT
jgi:hypothetical protein